MSYERWYFNRDKGRLMDVLKTKSWQDMFDTTEKGTVCGVFGVMVWGAVCMCTCLLVHIDQVLSRLWYY